MNTESDSHWDAPCVQSRCRLQTTIIRNREPKISAVIPHWQHGFHPADSWILKKCSAPPHRSSHYHVLCAIRSHTMSRDLMNSVHRSVFALPLKIAGLGRDKVCYMKDFNATMRQVSAQTPTTVCAFIADLKPASGISGGQTWLQPNASPLARTC